MDDVFTTFWGTGPVTVGVEPRSIVPAAGPLDAPHAAPSAEHDTMRCFVNDSLNSRVAQRVTDSTWRVLWRTDLPGAQTPLCLAGSHDGMVLQALTTWMLFQPGGKLVASAAMEASGLTVDAENSVFYLADHAGLLDARRLSDGQRAFQIAFYYAADYARTFVARRGRFLVTTSTARPLDPHGPDPETSMVEITDLRDAHAPKSFDRPGGAVGTADLIRATKLLLTAMHGDEIYLATEDRIYRLDLTLKFLGVLHGSFHPLAMSLDEAGRIYLVVETNGRVALWLVSQAGERYYAAVLPPFVTTTYAPVIGYDHVAYILFNQHILAVATDGKLKWSRSADARVSGAVATADDELVAAAGDQLLAYNARGVARVLIRIPGERFATPPMFTTDGDIVVASSAFLYRFTTKPAL